MNSIYLFVHAATFVMLFVAFVASSLMSIIGTKMYRNDSTVELFDCLSNVTLTYFHRQTIYMYFERFDSAAADAFARAVPSPKVIMPYSSFAADVYMKGVFAFWAEDRELYKQLLNMKQQSYFVALWTRQRPMNYIRRVFRDFWGHLKHTNVVGLVTMNDGSVHAYTYRPFSNYGCGKLGRPFLLDRWENGSFRWAVDLFSLKPKTGNMLGCPLKCVGNEHPPDSVLRWHDRRWTTSGVGGKMLQIVAEHMNFTPVITSPKDYNVSEFYSWYYSAAVLDNITAMLYADEADLAFGWYSYATHDSVNTELAKTTSIDCLGWAVPYRAGPPPQSWTNYVYEFDKVGWLFIGSMFIIVIGQ